jgi:hypothetical protein
LIHSRQWQRLIIVPSPQGIDNLRDVAGCGIMRHGGLRCLNVPIELLTKRDGAVVAAAAALMVVVVSSGLNWLAGDYTSVSLSADQGRLGRY